MYGRDTLHECHYPALQDTMAGLFTIGNSVCLSVCPSSLLIIFIGPMCTWGPIIGWQCLYKSFLTLVDYSS